MIHHGNALDVLRTMPEASAQMCVTSPPYWGLRDYGTGRWEGGAADCDHKPTRGIQGTTGERANRTFTAEMQYKETCGKCGAVRVDEQIGLERTPEEYTAKIVDVFRELRRVLKLDGVLWLNMGDSYATGAGAVGNCPGAGEQGEKWRGSRSGHEGKHGYSESARGTGALTQPNRMPIPGLKPKDLVGIPWRVAFALQADGWWLRQDVIWAKPNPMPESVKDRCTKAHEYLFMLTKSAKYFYDADALREPHAEVSIARAGRKRLGGKFAGADRAEHSPLKMGDGYGPNGNRDRVCSPGGRNRRSVWVMSTLPTPEAHFATFPIDLAQDCILAGSRPGDTVIDPFAGAGTTWLACLKHGREFVGIELNAEYIDIAHKRVRKHSPLLAGGAA